MNLAALIGFAMMVLVTGMGGGEVLAASASDGFIQFDPPQSKGCVAIRIIVPEDKMLVGMRWFNGAATEVLPKVLVGTGNGLTPPAYAESELFAENLQGQEHDWSEVLFESPVASESGSLFLIVEYPANYATPSNGPVLGVGYRMERAQYPYFVTGDGETWIKVAGSCRVLLEPILAVRTPGVACPTQKVQNEPELLNYIQITLGQPAKSPSPARQFDS